MNFDIYIKKLKYEISWNVLSWIVSTPFLLSSSLHILKESRGVYFIEKSFLPTWKSFFLSDFFMVLFADLDRGKKSLLGKNINEFLGKKFIKGRKIYSVFKTYPPPSPGLSKISPRLWGKESLGNNNDPGDHLNLHNL